MLKFSILLFCLMCSSTYGQDFRITTDININEANCGSSYAKSIIYFKGQTCLSILNLIQLPNSSKINAFHFLSNNELIFTLNVPSKINNTIYFPNDIIQFDGSNYHMYRSGDSIGIEKSVKINALTQYNDDIYFSINTTSKIKNILIIPSSIAILNSSNTVSIYKNASNLGLSSKENINALHVDATNIYFSTDTMYSAGNDFVAKSDVATVTYNSQNPVTVFSPKSHNSDWYKVNITGLFVAPLSDLIFTNGFEDLDSIFKNGFE